MTLHLLHLKNYPIFEQLKLEEALLRKETRNFCIINEGTKPAIVMGISGKPEELIDKSKISISPIPIIKRFSGGGTVIVDEDTLFVTFIFQKEVHDFAPYPEPIMQWSAELYRSFFPVDHFNFQENDYVIGKKKCGGNAQYVKKDRWLHHTSFLWDYKQENMQYLLHPKKTPQYRSNRSHDDFLCRLSDHISDKGNFLNSMKQELQKRYDVKEVHLEDLKTIIDQPHRKATTFIDF